MTWRVNAQQFTTIERDGGLVCRLNDALGWDGQNLAIHFRDIFRTIDSGHACDEFRWFCHVARTARMYHQFGIGEFLHHQARTACMIKVNVGEDDVVHSVHTQAELGKCFKGIGHRVVATCVHKGDVSFFNNQIHGRQLRARVACVDAVNAIAIVVPIEHDECSPFMGWQCHPIYLVYWVHVL